MNYTARDNAYRHCAFGKNPDARYWVTEREQVFELHLFALEAIQRAYCGIPMRAPS